jgi:hypothetical protein
MTRRSTTGYAVSLVALAVLLGGCSREVAADDIEASITEQVEQQGLVVQSVDCPAGLPPEVGATVVCDVELTGVDETGAEVDRFRVEVVEVEGDEVRYTLEPLAVGDTG